MRTYKAAVTTAAAILVAACTPVVPSAAAEAPETTYAEASFQAPVALRAGLYNVQLGGGTLVELRSGKREDRICLDPESASRFPQDPLGASVKPWTSCSDEHHAPRGNAMSGARHCTQRRMPMIARYSGTHTADYFKLAGSVAQGMDESGDVKHLGSGEFTIVGKRIGDCVAGFGA